MPADIATHEDDVIRVEDEEILASTRAMASRVTIRISRESRTSEHAQRENLDALCEAAREVLELFHEVEATCTRFKQTSPLSRANAEPTRWHHVPEILINAVTEAFNAYQATAGRFDPRVINALQALGYQNSLPFESGGVVTRVRSNQTANIPLATRDPWRPRKRASRRALHLGGAAIDLGGIGKGLAVRWANERLSRASANFLVEAGGDCYCAGLSAEGGPWHIGVEDPFGGSTPVAVLKVRDQAVATSSTRLRRWRADGELVHHLIDPATGRPGGEGLLAVTVIARDPAWAEIWSKVLFLEGARSIAGASRRQDIDALWITEDGSVSICDSLGSAIVWSAR